jgi:glucokinase
MALPPTAPVLALDIGGTKLAAAVIAPDGTLIARARTNTPSTAEPDALFAALEHLYRTVMQQAGAPAAAIGVGCGGPMRYPEGIVSPLNIPAWRDFPLGQRLSEAFGLPWVVDNDAKAFVLGERWQGAGRGSNNVLGMVVSTGVGGGIVLDGRLLHGQQGNAGHIGHVIVWPGGPPCECGAHGCLEAVASGTGLARRLATALADGQPSSLSPGAGAAEIASAARVGDPLATELFRTAGEALGRGIASAAALVDLERVILGGSIALLAWDLLGPPLEHELRASARLAFTRDVPVSLAELGEAAGLYGAAALAFSAPRSEARP